MDISKLLCQMPPPAEFDSEKVRHRQFRGSPYLKMMGIPEGDSSNIESREPVSDCLSSGDPSECPEYGQVLHSDQASKTHSKTIHKTAGTPEALAEIRSQMEDSVHMDDTLESKSSGQAKESTTPASYRQFQEFITIVIDGVEYTVTSDNEEIDVQFSNQTSLLISTARELFKATGKQAFEIIAFSGEVGGMRFELW